MRAIAMRGFTLIELVATIVILAIVATSVIVYFPSQTIFNVSTLAEQLKRDIRYTQSLAMSLNEPFTLHIEPHRYYITPTPPQGPVNEVLPDEVSLSGTSLTFNKEGTPSNSNNETISIASVDLTKTLTVVPETGLVYE